MRSSQLPLAVRALARRPGYTLLNVVGLAVGMAACLAVGLYVYEEAQVDRFHEHVDRLVQVGQVLPDDRRSLGGPFPLAELMAEALPSVEVAARTHPRPVLPVAREEGGYADAVPGLYTEPAFFDAFSFRAVAGDPRAALAAPDGLVITERLARAAFGDADPLGRTLQIGGVGQNWRQIPEEARVHTVRAVVETPPARSTVRFDVLAPLGAIPPVPGVDPERLWGWEGTGFRTYAVLAPGVDLREVEAGVGALAATPAGGGAGFRPLVIPLRDVYFSELHAAEGFRGQRRYVYVFGFAAAFILGIAATNYVNLATAQGLRRAREVGVRKALGASRGQVAAQFVGESVLLSAAALGLGLLLAAAMLPVLNDLLGADLRLSAYPGAVALLAVVVLGVGVAAAAYPAFLLSGFQPARVLRAYVPSGSGGGGWLRRGLVVVQFAASSVLLVGTAIVAAQLRYVQTQPLGFAGEQVVVFDLPSRGVAPALDALREGALAHPGVEAVTFASGAPGLHGFKMGAPRSALSPGPVPEGEERVELMTYSADRAFFSTLGMTFVAGVGFDAVPEGAPPGVVINETAARHLGWTPEEALGRPFAGNPLAMMGARPPQEVIGVVRDFHVGALHTEVPAVAITRAEQPASQGGLLLAARLARGEVASGVVHLEGLLRPYIPEGSPTPLFLDETFHGFYEGERRLARLVGLFAALAGAVACFGLFGLTALAAEQRTREIGIRKVLGATVAGLLVLLTRDFLKLVALGFALGAPLAVLAARRWLEGFAYRVEVGPALLAATAALALGLALLTVSAQALRAARMDPVRTLRSE